MPHIPQDEIERLKKEVSLQRLVESAGIALKKHGKKAEQYTNQYFSNICPIAK